MYSGDSMTSSHSHTQHFGETSVQQKRHTPAQLTQQIPSFMATEMPTQHADFYTGLSYLPLCTLDQQGRPWASILITKSDSDPAIGIQLLADNELKLSTQLSTADPFFRSVKMADTAKVAQSNQLFAGVGVDFANRRRNKLAGNIKSVAADPSGRLQLRLKSDEHLGNCPKYITVRDLSPYNREAEVALDSFESLNDSLSDECKDVINQASTVFLATKHIPKDSASVDTKADMGLNHRGGTPGFVRTYEETDESSEHSKVTTFLVLPDYSGNRFYQSLGNIESDVEVGLVFADFINGHMLYVTGHAENLFDDAAQALMPRMSLVTRIRITGAVFIKGALNLRMMASEQLSPYNPPIRYLQQEIEQMGHTKTSQTTAEQVIKATLISAQKLTSSMSTFTFELSMPIKAPAAGGFGVFDFSEQLDVGYSHMDEMTPQQVNEDYIRTWTLSSAASFNGASRQFDLLDRVEITVKRKPGGLVSNFLHDQSASLSNAKNKTWALTFNGTGQGFSCFNQAPADPLPRVPSKMLWVAGGVGVTPFMSMWDGIKSVCGALANSQTPLVSDIVLMFAGRDDDIAILKHFLKDQAKLAPSISLTIMAYQSLADAHLKAEDIPTLLKNEYPQASLSIDQKRLNETDFANIDSLLERDVFLCGPDNLMNSTQDWLQALNVDPLNIHRESYFF